MTKFLYLLVAVFLFTACKNNEPSIKIAELENYGVFDVKTDEAVSVAEMQNKFKAGSEPMVFTFEGNINGVCAKAGCWVSVEDGKGGDFMIRFKDHFTIPTDTDLNQTAYIHGLAYWEEISVEDLKEYAEEEGKTQAEIDAIVNPEYVFSFEADGIKIKKVADEE